MKILHTSDWHLGKSTWNHSRQPDHEAVLAEIAEIAAAERPDLILNTGDLFDQQRPPVQAMKLATDALRELSAIAPVIVISGNHDSPPLLHWLGGLLRHDDRIHIVADPDAVRVGAIHRIPATDGRIHIAALPFITANRMVNVHDAPDERRKAYAEHIAALQRDLMDRLYEDFDPGSDVTVLAAHQFVAGSIPARTENPNHTCDFYATDPQHVPPVDYAAFGHIHKPQKLPGSRVVGAYAGAPIQLDFGEAGEAKSLIIADLQPAHPTQLRRVPLHAGRNLAVLTGSIDELRAIADTVTDDICRVVVNTGQHEPTLSRQIQSLLPGATIVHIDENAADRKLELITTGTPTSGEPDNLEMFGAYLAEHGARTAPAERVLDLFGTLLSHTDDQQPPTLDAERLLAEDLSTFALPDEEEPAA